MQIFNIKFAIRNLLKNKIFSAVNLIGLTIGMVASMLIFIWAQNEWSFDRFYKNTENIYRVICHWEGQGEHLNISRIPIRLRDLANEAIPEIEDFFIMHPGSDNPLISTSTGEVFEEKDLAYISNNWLIEFGYTVLRGSINNFQSNKFSVALTEERAKKFFGDADPIGKTVEIYSKNYTIALVLKNNPINSSFQQKVFVPLESYWPHRVSYEKEIKSSNYKFVAFFRTFQEADPKKIEAKFTELMSQVDQNKPTSCSIIPLKNMRFNEQLKSDVFNHQSKSTVSIFVLIGIIILLVALLNYINLSTAIINKRVKQIGIKKIIGASFKSIFFQIFAEATIISGLSFLFAILAAYFLLPFLASYTGQTLQLNFTNKYLWYIFSLMLLVSILLATVYPALLIARTKPIQLINNERTPSKGISLRRILVTSQFTAVIVVLISTTVIYQQLRFIQSKEVGYDRSQVLSLKLKYNAGDDYRKNLDQFQLLKKEIEQMTEFESIAITDGNVADISNRNSGSLYWEGKPKDQSVIVAQLKANEELITVFDLEIKRGRWFEPNNTNDRNNIIINETAIETFNIPKPVLGRKSSFQGREGQIIGVVKDFIFADLHQNIEPLVIWHNQGRGHTLLAKIHSNKTHLALTQLKKSFKRFFPNKPFEYSFLDDTFQQMHQADTKAIALLYVFTIIITFISCLGLLGLTVFEATRRKKEVAIRKVLGASLANITTNLSKHYFMMVSLAFLIAIPIALYFVQKWLHGFAFRVDLSLWTFIIPGITALVISIITMSFQSIKAAIANPVDALRS